MPAAGNNTNGHDHRREYASCLSGRGEKGRGTEWLLASLLFYVLLLVGCQQQEQQVFADSSGGGGPFVTFARAAGTSEVSVYEAGDLVKNHPIETMLIFSGVVIASALLEWLLALSTRVKAKYFQVLFSTVNQEVMIVGVLVLALLFAENLYEWPKRWILIFKYSMMTLFLMIICFIILILTILLRARWADREWSRFEAERMDAEGGSGFSNREAKYKASFFRFLGALTAYGYSANMGIRYSTYLSKLMRRNVVALADLTWVSWVCLATVVVVNALRTEGFRRLSEVNDENLDDSHSIEQRLLLYLSFIIIIGYGLLALFIAMHWSLSSRLDKFLAAGAASAAGGSASGGGGAGAAGGLQQRLLETGALTNRQAAVDNLDDSRAFLFRRSLEVTLEMLQTLLLSLLWYMATFLLSFSYQLGAHMPEYAAPIIVLAVLPIAVVIVLLPWTLMLITILGSLGNNLEEHTVQTQIRKAGVPIDELPEKMQAALRANAQRKLMRQVRRSGMQARQTAIRAHIAAQTSVAVPRSLQQLRDDATAPIGL